MDCYEIKHNLAGKTKIWRYMDLTKFNLLLCREKMWFSRADLLGDDHEGAYPKQLISERKKRIGNEKLINTIATGSKYKQKCTFVSCWTMNNPESLTMWNIYTPKAAGVAIETSVENLSNCFVIDKPKIIMDILSPKIVKIQYDKDKDGIHDPKTYNAYEHKLKAYKYEKEIRIMIHHFSIRPPGAGLELSVDINKLIKRIYLSNRFSDEIEQTVKELLVEKNMVKCIKKPSFTRPPLF